MKYIILYTGIYFSAHTAHYKVDTLRCKSKSDAEEVIKKLDGCTYIASMKKGDTISFQSHAKLLTDTANVGSLLQNSL